MMARGNVSNHKKKWMTMEEFTDWKANDYAHLVNDVKELKRDAKFNKRLLIGILIAVIALPTAFMICVVQLIG